MRLRQREVGGRRLATHPELKTHSEGLRSRQELWGHLLGSEVHDES